MIFIKKQFQEKSKPSSVGVLLGQKWSTFYWDRKPAMYSTRAFFVSGAVELMINTGIERIGPYVKSSWWGRTT